MTIDWTTLREVAVRVAGHAYAPYSGLRVGAAGITTTGEIVTGCNVENASFGLTLCAECGLVSDLRRVGASRLVAVAVVDGEGDPLMPCGRCRQVLWEHGGPTLLIGADPEPVPLSDLLPRAFDSESLPET
jgi:cytidine deaminase